MANEQARVSLGPGLLGYLVTCLFPSGLNQTLPLADFGITRRVQKWFFNVGAPHLMLFIVFSVSRVA